MFSNISFSKYCDINSTIHNLNPIVKVMCFILFSISIFIKADLVYLGVLLMLLVILVFMSNINIKLFLNEFGVFKYFLLLLFVINAIIGFELENNFIIIIRILLLLFNYTLFILTTSYNSIVSAFNVIFYPFNYLKINSYSIALYIADILIFIPKLLDSFNVVAKSISLRGLDFKTSSILNKLKILHISFIPTFKLNFRNSRVSDLLNIKNYNSSNRSCYKKFRIGFNDILILSIHVFFVVAVIIKDVVL